MNLEEKFKEIIKTLSQGHRYLKALEQNEIEWIEQNAHKLEGKELKMFFCILENTQTKDIGIGEKLCELMLQRELSDEDIVFALNASRRQVIEALQLKGKRLPAHYLSLLEGFLQHKNPEVVQWTLRLIDECGSQGIYFKKFFPSIKPSLFRLYNKNYRAVLELITFLERKWTNSQS